MKRTMQNTSFIFQMIKWLSSLQFHTRLLKTSTALLVLVLCMFNVHLGSLDLEDFNRDYREMEELLEFEEAEESENFRELAFRRKNYSPEYFSVFKKSVSWVLCFDCPRLVDKLSVEKSWFVVVEKTWLDDIILLHFEEEHLFLFSTDPSPPIV